MNPWPGQPHDLTRFILERRPPKNRLDPQRAYGAFVEQERDAGGVVRQVATLLLTNRECPFRCLMCDLWRNTLDEPTPAEAIPRQIERALAELPPAEHIKLYNAGNFFDGKAIPRRDWPEVVRLLRPFRHVVVESHPRLIDARALELRDLLGGHLEVAIGLEIVHPQVLALLNKSMTLADFSEAVGFLRHHDIDVRCFILLRPPLLSEQEGLEWACRSIDFAFETGVQTCVLVPTRSGNGALEAMAKAGLFAEPQLASLEDALAWGLQRGGGRVFADLWDLQRIAPCPMCAEARRARLERMNLTQQFEPKARCACEAGA